jgi:hypothetical protein
MKYVELLWMLDLLAKYYPRSYSHDLIMLSEDIFKWLNNELPDDSSTLVYLKSCFDSPAEAFKAVWKELQLMAGPFASIN